MRVALVDLDGTLVDESEAIARAGMEVLGRRVSKAELRTLSRALKTRIYDLAITKFSGLMKPNEEVVRLVDTLRRSGFKIVILTARLESTRRETESLLARIGVKYDELVMRESLDIKDEVWKTQVVRSYERTHDIVIVLEDKWDNVEYMVRNTQKAWVLFVRSTPKEARREVLTTQNPR